MYRTQRDKQAEMYKAITEEYCEENIMSALLLKDFIKSL